MIKQNVLSTNGNRNPRANGLRIDRTSTYIVILRQEFLDYTLYNVILRVKLVKVHCQRPRPPRPPMPLLLLPPLLVLLAISRPKATPPFRRLANLTAFWIFSSVSSARGTFPIFFLSLSIFANRLRDAFFSCSTDTSVGSNCDNL